MQEKTFFYYINIIKEFLIIKFWRFMYYFGIKQTIDPIPEGPYCYEIDEEKNNNRESVFEEFYIKPCIYYKNLGDNYNGCKYIGKISNDWEFEDQVKICGCKIETGNKT